MLKAADLFKNVNLLLLLGMKGLTIKINWYVSSKYLCISCNDQDTFFHAAMILTLLKLRKLGSQNHYETYGFKNRTIQAPMKMCGFRNILF